MCSTCTSLDCNCWTTSRGVPQSWPRLQRRTKLLSLAAGGDGIQWEIIDCYFHRSIFLYDFNYLKALQVPFLLCNLFISAELFTLLLLNKPTRFSLSVSLPSSMTPHTTLLLSHPLFIKTPQESSHTGLQLSDLQLFFCLACVSTILCNGFIITVNSFQHTCVTLVEKLSSGFPSSLKNIFVVKEMEEMEVVLMDFSSVFALITALNPYVIQILYITHDIWTHAHSYWDPKPHKCSAEQPESSQYGFSLRKWNV